MASISDRLPDERREELEAVAELLDLDERTTLRRALTAGLAELRIQRAVERYQTGDVSVAEAARIAGLNTGEWLEIARERGLTTQLSPADLKRDADAAREL